MNDDPLLEDLQQENQDMALDVDATIEAWIRMLDVRNKEAEAHTRRVTEMSLKLAYEMEIGDEQLVHLRHGALLHDIGMLAIPDAILLKPGVLTEDEWKWIRQHPVWGQRFLLHLKLLSPALDIVYCHHERWDGSGYPQGLKGGAIPRAARIFAVVDVWDALLADKPYRRGWPAETVISYLKDQAGKQFDPEVVAAFLRTVSDLRYE